MMTCVHPCQVTDTGVITVAVHYIYVGLTSVHTDRDTRTRADAKTDIQTDRFDRLTDIPADMSTNRRTNRQDRHTDGERTTEQTG